MFMYVGIYRHTQKDTKYTKFKNYTKNIHFRNGKIWGCWLTLTFGRRLFKGLKKKPNIVHVYTYCCCMLGLLCQA